jgi:hypothetical protein
MKGSPPRATLSGVVIALGWIITLLYLSINGGY